MWQEVLGFDILNVSQQMPSSDTEWKAHESDLFQSLGLLQRIIKSKSENYGYQSSVLSENTKRGLSIRVRAFHIFEIHNILGVTELPRWL